MMSLLQFLDVVVLPEILANSREMDWKTQPAASVWCASHHCILKDTIFGILLFFERLDDVRSFSNTDERFVFILKKMNGSFEPFTAFKRIDVLFPVPVSRAFSASFPCAAQRAAAAPQRPAAPRNSMVSLHISSLDCSICRELLRLVTLCANSF